MWNGRETNTQHFTVWVQSLLRGIRATKGHPHVFVHRRSGFVALTCGYGVDCDCFYDRLGRFERCRNQTLNMLGVLSVSYSSSGVDGGGKREREQGVFQA